MEIFSQLGELFLAAVPTVIVVFLFYLFLKWSFFGPIERVLHERAARIEGAQKEREAFHAAAQGEGSRVSRGVAEGAGGDFRRAGSGAAGGAR